eukprot:37200-Eustigmatos_ZCMA.PRE.1
MSDLDDARAGLPCGTDTHTGLLRAGSEIQLESSFQATGALSAPPFARPITTYQPPVIIAHTHAAHTLCAHVCVRV